MATLYVTEYRQLGSVQSGSNYSPQVAQAPLEPPLADYTVAISGSSTASPVFQGNTGLIRVHCDSVCSIVIGVAPVATTTNRRMAANQTEYFSPIQGAGTAQAIAVIANV